MAAKHTGVRARLILWFLPPLLGLIGSVFRLTWRVRYLHPEHRERARAAFNGGQVLAAWHQRLLTYIRPLRGTQAVTLTSLSFDGEIIARMMWWLGQRTARGSSSRRAGGALREMIELQRAGHSLCFVAGGPRGPMFECKLGPIAAARDSGAGAVTPVAAAVGWCLTLRSWDRVRIPLPFAKIVYAYGDPIPVPADADREQLEACRQQVEDALRTLTADCDRALGQDPAAADAHVRERTRQDGSA